MSLQFSREPLLSLGVSPLPSSAIVDLAKVFSGRTHASENMRSKNSSSSDTLWVTIILHSATIPSHNRERSPQQVGEGINR